MLTPEDVEFITLLIDERIEASRASRSTPRETKDYHTTYDIRALIRLHLQEFKQWVGKDSFQLPLLRHFLALKTTMRARDLDVMPNGRKGQSHCTRFDNQVANAIQTWVDGPFRKTDKLGHYELVNP